LTDAEGQITSHNLYYIIAREGSNRQPSVADSVYVAYDGKLIDGSSFDNRKFPIWIDLANSLQGFREGVSELRTGKYSENLKRNN
jgi:FKBP-type peptidyl-prolyl cis-trans isomerase FkpA